MQRLATVILRHQTAEGTHFDWLIAPPTAVADLLDDPQRLWTARVTLPPWRWGAVRPGRFFGTQLPPHRRVYLTHQGPIGGGRGSVTRVDRGAALPLRWTTQRIDLKMSTAHFQGLVRLEQVNDDLWSIAVQ